MDVWILDGGWMRRLFSSEIIKLKATKARNNY